MIHNRRPWVCLFLIIVGIILGFSGSYEKSPLSVSESPEGRNPTPNPAYLSDIMPFSISAGVDVLYEKRGEDYYLRDNHWIFSVSFTVTSYPDSTYNITFQVSSSQGNYGFWTWTIRVINSTITQSSSASSGYFNFTDSRTIRFEFSSTYSYIYCSNYYGSSCYGESSGAQDTSASKQYSFEKPSKPIVSYYGGFLSWTTFTKEWELYVHPESNNRTLPYCLCDIVKVYLFYSIDNGLHYQKISIPGAYQEWFPNSTLHATYPFEQEISEGVTLPGLPMQDFKFYVEWETPAAPYYTEQSAIYQYTYEGIPPWIYLFLSWLPVIIIAVVVLLILYKKGKLPGQTAKSTKYKQPKKPKLLKQPKKPKQPKNPEPPKVLKPPIPPVPVFKPLLKIPATDAKLMLGKLYIAIREDNGRIFLPTFQFLEVRHIPGDHLTFQLTNPGHDTFNVHVAMQSVKEGGIEVTWDFETLQGNTRTIKSFLKQYHNAFVKWVQMVLK